MQQQAKKQPGYRHPDRARDPGQEEAFRKKLTAQAQPGGSQNRPDRELGEPLLAPGKEEAGGIAAGNQQDQDGGGQQGVEHRPDIEHQVGTQGLKHDPFVFVGVGVLLGERIGNGAQIGLGLLQRDTWAQEADQPVGCGIRATRPRDPGG
jgi:hypothetical protein